MAGLPAGDAASQVGGVAFAFGGAFATSVYTGDLRNTKDFDFYILPAEERAGLVSSAH